MKPFITLLYVALICHFSQAQIFVNVNATGANDGSSWADAFTNLQDALDASTTGVQIWMAAGTYVPQGPTPDSSHFLAKNPIELYGGFAGTETSVSERLWELNRTILSGDILGDDVEGDFFSHRSDNAHHVIILHAVNGSSVIDGVFFTRGATRLDAYAGDTRDTLYNRWRGGGLYIKNSNANIRNAVFNDNYGFQGSAFWANGNTSVTNSLQLDNVSVTDNYAVLGGNTWISQFDGVLISNSLFRNNRTDSYGGGLNLGNTNATVYNTRFLDNEVPGIGGAVFTFQNASTLINKPVLHFEKCTFSGNKASNGGAIRMNNFVKAYSLIIDSCLFAGNAADTFGYAGAIDVEDFEDFSLDQTSDIIIRGSEFTGNSGGYGGAILVFNVDDTVNLIVDHSIFSNNSAIFGGAIEAAAGYGGKLINKFTNTTFSQNSANYHGGAVVFEQYQNLFNIRYLIEDCIFTGNVANFGGAISNLPSPPYLGNIGVIRNTEFLGNTGTIAAGAILSNAETFSVENSLFKNNLTFGSDPVYTGGGAILLLENANITLRNSIFDFNSSATKAGAFFIEEGSTAKFENSLFYNNQGTSTITNGGHLDLVNNTFSGNQSGMLLTGGENTFQNNIFNNGSDNLIIGGEPTITSLGGNISNDGTMSIALTGHNGYADIHNTDPLIGADFVPQTGSPAVDAGNPENILMPFDLAGNPRIHGNSIDIGSYESFLTSIKNATWNTAACIVYPNPVRDNLTFKIGDEWIGTLGISMYDQSGRLVMSETQAKSASTQQFTIGDLRLSPGEYYLMIKTDRKTFGHKVVVQ